MNDETKSWADLYDCADGDDRDESLLHLISHADSRYLSIELAGTGAMKKIICTEDKISGRTVAKALLKDPQDQQNIEPFLREARITAQLQHPNIVPVYDIGLDDEDNPFFTMKLITGFNLEQILTEIKQGNEQFVEAYPRAKLIEIFL
ncbi:MAG: hypothetical protein HRT88_06160 [Lentisphaeraceae bacterium]|nr:hypothetical protein [Lentisphaeraceae bacterium]